MSNSQAACHASGAQLLAATKWLDAAGLHGPGKQSLQCCVAPQRTFSDEDDALQNGEDRKRLSGPGLLLLERDVTVDNIKDYYLTADGNKLQLVAGDQLGPSSPILGRVLFCCRPPMFSSGPMAESAEVIQL